MANVYGQPPYFDNSTPDFSPVGTQLDIRNPEFSVNFITTIPFGPFVDGNRRTKEAGIVRYVYQYVNNSFVFYKKYKGVRKKLRSGTLNSVVDLADLNARSAIHATELSGTPPTEITQNILRSLFSFPSPNSYFFVEGAISVPTAKNAGNYSVVRQKQKFFSIYRYGKIENGVIVVCKESSDVKTKSGS